MQQAAAGMVIFVFLVLKAVCSDRLKRMDFINEGPQPRIEAFASPMDYPIEAPLKVFTKVPNSTPPKEEKPRLKLVHVPNGRPC